MTAAWTKDPKVTGAYWFKLGLSNKAVMTFIHSGRVVSMDGMVSAQEAYLTSGGMFYGPLDQPPPMTEQKEPEATTAENIPEFREHHDVAMLAVNAWAGTLQNCQVVDPAKFGEIAASIYASCLANLAEKPEAAKPSEPFKYPNMANPYNNPFGYKVQKGDGSGEANIAGASQCSNTKCCKGG